MSGETRGKRKYVSLRTKLIIILIFFVLLLLMTLWAVQICLLDFFYEREKNKELHEVAQSVAEVAQTAECKNAVEQLARDNLTCIRVFAVTGSGLEERWSADILSGCFIHPMTGEAVNVMYKKTKENGGSYSKRVGFRGNGEDRISRSPWKTDQMSNVMYAEVFYVEDQAYFLMLDAELTPLSTMVKTLVAQFSWISVTMLALTLLLALALSALVVTPLKGITKKAGQLAKGDYTADFEGKGYLEVEELAGALNYAACEIGKTDALQKELIANISHDLRTPLTMIRGYSEMMRDIPGENTPENVQVIIDENERLSELVNDLLDLSKLQAGTVKPEPVRFDLSRAVREVLARYEELLRPGGYRLEYRVSPEENFVFADRTMILQALYNLMNNAVNYTGEDLLITVTEEVMGDRVRISVRDTGEGIEPELIPQIWDRYYRVDKVHKRAVFGTGLGLSIVKEVFEKHHAHYGVDSAVGVGSVFWFELSLLDRGQKKDEG